MVENETRSVSVPAIISSISAAHAVATTSLESVAVVVAALSSTPSTSALLPIITTSISAAPLVTTTSPESAIVVADSASTITDQTMTPETSSATMVRSAPAAMTASQGHPADLPMASSTTTAIDLPIVSNSTHPGALQTVLKGERSLVIFSILFSLQFFVAFLCRATNDSIEGPVSKARENLSVR